VEVIRDDDVVGVGNVGSQETAILGPQCDLDGHRGVKGDDRQLRPRRALGREPGGRGPREPPAASKDGEQLPPTREASADGRRHVARAGSQPPWEGDQGRRQPCRERGGVSLLIIRQRPTLVGLRPVAARREKDADDARLTRNMGPLGCLAVTIGQRNRGLDLLFRSMTCLAATSRQGPAKPCTPVRFRPPPRTNPLVGGGAGVWRQRPIRRATRKVSVGASPDPGQASPSALGRAAFDAQRRREQPRITLTIASGRVQADENLREVGRMM
jgi:hypothetical protein